MNAAEILKSQGRTLPTHPITIRLVDPSDPTRVADGPACLRFVSDRVRYDAMDDAAAELSKLKTPPTPERRAAEEAYHFLVRAVRQSEAPAQPFFQTALEAKNMLTADEAIRIHNEYDRFSATHAPQFLPPDKIAEVRKDAENFSAIDLLRRHGYWNVLRLLPSLAIESGSSLTPTS